MKTIDTKSLLLGVCAAGLIFTLTSSRMSEGEAPLEFSGSPAGILIYNKQIHTVSIYPSTIRGSLTAKPLYTYKVADDGTSLTEIK